MAKGLKDVGTDVAVGLYTNSGDLNNALHVVTVSPQFQSILKYAKVHCTL